MGSFEDEFKGADPKGYAPVEAIDGRAVIIFANESKTMNSTVSEGTFSAVFADVIVLDGDPDPENGIDSIPAVLENMMFTGQIVGATKRTVGKRRPVLGRINSQPSRYNRKITTYGIGELSTAEKSRLGDLAVQAKRDYLSALEADEFAAPARPQDEEPPF